MTRPPLCNRPLAPTCANEVTAYKFILSNDYKIHTQKIDRVDYPPQKIERAILYQSRTGFPSHEYLVIIGDM